MLRSKCALGEDGYGGHKRAYRQTQHVGHLLLAVCTFFEPSECTTQRLGTLFFIVRHELGIEFKPEMSCAWLFQLRFRANHQIGQNGFPIPLTRTWPRSSQCTSSLTSA